MYFLIDANVAAGYYLPRSLRSIKARLNCKLILDYVRTHPTEHFIYVPNFCIAETFSVFMKHSYGRWNRDLKSTGTIDTRVYKKLCRQFQSDIHNGRFMYHYELSRYHILGINLVAPIDHYYKVSRKTKKNRKNKSISPMSTFDHLIISMGIHLSHIHGCDNVCLLSCDNRLINILAKCKSQIRPAVVKKLGLDRARDLTGHHFGPNIFPKHLNLKDATTEEYQEIFPSWPLPTEKVKNVYRHEK